MEPLCTTWANVERRILKKLISIAQCAQPPEHPPSEPPHEYAAHVKLCVAAFPPSVDAVLNTLRYMFFGMRCGILVAIRGGHMALFAPFANAQYRNTWSQKLHFQGGSAAAYVAAKCAETRKSPEAWLPPEAWWMNGGILCNVAPPGIWGDAHCAELMDMIAATCAAHVIPDCNFFINKRDYPHLRRNGGEPYARFTGRDTLSCEAYRSYAPIFSFYTGTAFADVPIPLTEDWRAVKEATAETATKTDGLLDSWPRAAPVAVFRGTATGNGITADSNVRIRLVQYSALHSDVCDCQFVGYNQRDKVTAVDEAGIHVGFLRAASLPPLAPRMSMDQQAAAYKYVLYADGHCAANRYGALMRSRRPILRIGSEREADGGSLWLFHGLVGATVLHATTPPANVHTADHFVIAPTLDNLAATVHFLRTHDDVAQAVAARAWEIAPTRTSILAAWKVAMCAVAEWARAETAAETAGGDGKVWFSPYDSRYALIGRRDSSQRMVAAV